MKKLAAFIIGALLLILVCGTAAGDQRTALPVLMYHHIRTDPAQLGAYVISPETFEGDLKWLSEHGYETVDSARLIAFCSGRGELPPKPVMITFDDGQESFLAFAVPLLEKYGMCAVMNVVGAYADFFTANPDHNVAYSYLDWYQIAELSKTQAAEIGVHSFDLHYTGAGREGCRIKPGESVREYEAVMNADLGEIESRFRDYGVEAASVFAYPFGFICPEAKALLVHRGYQILLTCEQRTNMLTGDPDELLSLGRYNRAETLDRERLFRYIGMR